MRRKIIKSLTYNFTYTRHSLFHIARKESKILRCGIPGIFRILPAPRIRLKYGLKNNIFRLCVECMIMPVICRFSGGGGGSARVFASVSYHRPCLQNVI